MSFESIASLLPISYWKVFSITSWLNVLPLEHGMHHPGWSSYEMNRVDEADYWCTVGHKSL